jgi:hypothetical protein
VVLFRETGVVHRITYNICYLSITCRFINSSLFLIINTGLSNEVKQTQLYFCQLITVAGTRTPTSLPYATDSLNGRKFSLTAANVFPFKHFPILPLLPISNGFCIYVIIPYITGASKPNKRLYQNDLLQRGAFKF